MTRVSTLKCLIAFALTVSTGAVAAAAPVAGVRPAPPARFTFFAAGDLLGPYRNTVRDGGAETQRVLDLARASDAGFANQEGNGFAVAGFPGYLAAENGGGYPRHEPAVLAEFAASGLTLISRANNHATDWGVEGMVASDRALDALGLTRAGTGDSLAAARAPGYRQTPAGRVALVATASTFTGMSPAGAPARGAGPRPGLNPLHVDPVRLLAPAAFEAMRQVAVATGWQGYDLPGTGATELHLDERTYRRATRTGLTYAVNQADRDALIASVAEARAKAGFVAFSIHAHETLSGGYEDPAPADFLRPLFHAAIDAGADVVVRHGPHAVQGVEIYAGKPIFYGLGSLFFDLDKTITIASDDPVPQKVELPDSWYEGIAAQSLFERGRLVAVRLYPLRIESTAGPARGTPRLAHGADAARILGRLVDGSRQFGTAIAVDGDVAVVRLRPEVR